MGEQTLRFPCLVEADVTRAKNVFLSAVVTYGTSGLQAPSPFSSINMLSFLSQPEIEIRPQAL